MEVGSVKSLIELSCSLPSLMRRESRICGEGIWPTVTVKVCREPPSFPTPLDLAVDVAAVVGVRCVLESFFQRIHPKTGCTAASVCIPAR